MPRFRSAVRSIVGILLLATGLAGCPASEDVLLLEVVSQSDVETLDITVLDADGRRIAQQNTTLRRTAEDIAGEPIHVVIPVPDGGAVTVLLSGREPIASGSGALVATRCYVVSGVVQDDVLLVAIDPSLDADGDGFPLQASVTCRDLGSDGVPVVCDVGMCPDSAVADCDDTNPDRFPGNATICENDIDENCRNDGNDDDDDEPCGDADMDGWNACSGSSLPGSGTCDCADDNRLVNPDAAEICNDRIDQNCDLRDALCDLDGDGFPADVLMGGSPDCNDDDDSIYPGAPEVCDDRIDNNCNRLVDEGSDCAPDDLDRDGWTRCAAGCESDCDCDDCNGAVFPGAPEVCDGLDQETGELVPATGDRFPDCPGDGDGDGEIGSVRDCNEGDERVYQGAPENCMTPVVESCSSTSSTLCMGLDSDADGFVDTQDCDIPMMDGRNPSINPFAREECDDVDNDCDGIVNERTSDNVGVGCVFDPSFCGSEVVACEVTFGRTTISGEPGATRHCGGCGIDCNPDGQVIADRCTAGACSCSTNAVGGGVACSGVDTCCGSGCADLATSHDNCGDCGFACGGLNSANPECVAGACVCPATGAVCTGAASNCCGSGCVDLANDPLNCGTCGHECGSNAVCNSGMCQCANNDVADCDTDLNRAGVLVSNGCEVPLNVPGSCGACTTNCGSLSQVATASCGGPAGGRVCVVDSCLGNFANCDGDPDNGCEVDLRNVNSCGTTCLNRVNCGGLPFVGGTSCSAGGACVITGCSPLRRGDCDTLSSTGCETDLWVNTSCGTMCGGRTNCTGLLNVDATTCPTGSCVITSCDPGFGDCGGGAGDGCETNIWQNNACGLDCGSRINCGTRPNAMASGTCVSGTCSITCNGGFADCSGGTANGCETPIWGDNSCGSGCGTRADCDALPRVANGDCNVGTCNVNTCDPGYLHCDSDHANGCEVNIWANNSCGTVCASGSRLNCTDRPSTTGGTCSGGTCNITCTPGSMNCDTDPADGCEVNVWANNSCGTVCAAGSRVNCTDRPNSTGGSCNSGTCNLMCDPGYLNCDGDGSNGCEVNIWANNSCGTMCASGSRLNCTTLPDTMSGSCNMGTCMITCPGGRNDCNSNPADGCETTGSC